MLDRFYKIGIMLLFQANSASRRRVIALFVAGVLCLLAAPPQAQASIQAGPSAFDSLATLDPTLSAEQLDKVLEQLSESSGAQTSTGAKTSGRRVVDQPASGGGPEPSPVEVRHYANLSPDAGLPGGSTTSTSSSAGAAGGMGLALYAAAAPHLSDDAPVERYAAERSLFLPEAPGTELLRPPRG